jgi:tetratricopeptide (TPR) repeat protein
MKTWSVWFLCVTVAAVLMIGCGGGKLPEAEQQQEQAKQLPEGHPPVGGQSAPMMGSLGDEGPTDEDPLPLKLDGLNGVKELNRALAGTDNPEARELFTAGFRKTFTADASKRDYQGAASDLEEAIQLDPNYAQAYRALGYAMFNIGFNVDAAMANYQKAIELKPDYGEAHYALAFMYAMGDRSKGTEHFKKAMELGVPDERNLGERFYSGN